VQLGTINYVRPQAAREVADGIAAYLEQKGMSGLHDLPLRRRPVLARV
jgi:dihydroorotate dehydrogenase